eukprot:TRINITY_DN7437_c0_g2_i4.p1 TRINITY_DN7437_c0_g2~~TRINITY_DN7437_c0_g2_i4.p1  ORF type:complete len:127 (-),score=20.83 TRINITY_DN7437_c0_g2_i4:281-661(-)
MFGYLSHLVGFDSQSSKYKPPVYQVPRDEQDPAFVLSFKIDDEKGIKEFFTQFGFVVVRDVLTKGSVKIRSTIYENTLSKGNSHRTKALAFVFLAMTPRVGQTTTGPLWQTRALLELLQFSHREPF